MASFCPSVVRLWIPVATEHPEWGNILVCMAYQKLPVIHSVTQDSTSFSIVVPSAGYGLMEGHSLACPPVAWASATHSQAAWESRTDPVSCPLFILLLSQTGRQPQSFPVEEEERLEAGPSPAWQCWTGAALRPPCCKAFNCLAACPNVRAVKDAGLDGLLCS